MTITALPAKYDNEIKSTFPDLEALLSGKPADGAHKHVGNAPRTIPLIVGSEDEADPLITNTGATMTPSRDTVNYVFGGQSHKLSIDGAMSVGTARWDPIGAVDPFPMGAAGTIFQAIYLAEGSAANITSVTVEIYMDSANSKKVSLSIAAVDLADGWNYIVRATTDGLTVADCPYWGNVYRVRYTIVTTGAADISLQLWVQAKPKGQIVFVNDGPYLDFIANMYPLMKARNLPVEFGLDPGGMGTTDRPTWEQLAAVMEDGNGNVAGIHGYDSATDDNSTDALCRTNTMKALKELAAHGYSTMWRSAFLSNDAPGHAGIDDWFPAYATYTGIATAVSWPARHPKNLARLPLHSISTAALDDAFTRLKYAHCLYFFYTHKCTQAGGDFDISFERRDYFLSKVDAGIAEGWLEFVTFDQLAAELGWHWEQDAIGRRVIVVPSTDGTATRYYQP